MSTDDTRGDILVAYDGSEIADEAIERAAALFTGRTLKIITVWRSAAGLAGAARAAMPDDVIRAGIEGLDRQALEDAEATARRGAELAAAAGAEADWAAALAGRSVWVTILDEAARADAAAIVVGARGRSGIASIVLGGVSSGVVQHARRPVLVVHPSAPEDHGDDHARGG